MINLLKIIIYIDPMITGDGTSPMEDTDVGEGAVSF